ncbi:hypothetical protein BK011_03475 [Tenericutes bacterium MZ-XQ]|nr:hypothetical protein BK011_03475 [Tenericutes bacterium MZ-XQ]
MIRLARVDDIDQIWQLRLETSELLKERHIDQWQYHKPEKSTILEDIELGEFFIDEVDNYIVGMIAIKKGIEHTYNQIFGGSWGYDRPYMTIHRLAVKKDCLGKNISINMMKFAHEYTLSQGLDYIRIDTHEDNKYAQRLFTNLGYKLRGFILLDENHPGERKRLAFDIKLKQPVKMSSTKNIKNEYKVNKKHHLKTCLKK